jgi:IclR family transcriptional regulator, acetate operon repressor
VRLCRATAPEPRLRRLAGPALERLSKTTGWPSGVFVLSGDAVTTVAVADWLDSESQAPFPPLRPGLDFPLTTAAGKVVMASAGASRPRELSPADWDDLHAQLRRTGVVVESEAVARDVGCVAASVTGSDGRVVAAVCVVTLRNAATPRVLRAVREAAAQIGEALDAPR